MNMYGFDGWLFKAVKTGNLANVKRIMETGKKCLYDYTMQVSWSEDTRKKTRQYGNAIYSMCDVNGCVDDCYAVEIAAESTAPDAFAILRYLVENGADVNIHRGVALANAAKNTGRDAFSMVKYLLKHGAKVNAYDKSENHALKNAARNPNPDAFAMVKHLVEHGADIHSWDLDWGTALTASLCGGNIAIADYLFSREDFLPRDLIPRPRNLPADIYGDYRERALSRTVEICATRGIEYARTISQNIDDIIHYTPEPTKEDVEMLKKLTGKIASIDWMGDAQVSSYEFLDCYMER